MLHTGPQLDITLGRGVSVGHGAILHGCTVGDGCLIGMHATVLDGAVLGEGCLVAAGALVPEGTVVPPYSLVVGVPGRVRGPVRPDQTARPSPPTWRNTAALPPPTPPRNRSHKKQAASAPRRTPRHNAAGPRPYGRGPVL